MPNEKATPEVPVALEEGRAFLRGDSGGFGQNEGALATDLLRDLVEAVDHARNSAGHHADRLLRAEAGDEECRDSHVEDATALAQAVALRDHDPYEYMVCVGGGCMREEDYAIADPAAALARARQLADDLSAEAVAEGDDPQRHDPVQIIVTVAA